MKLIFKRATVVNSRNQKVQDIFVDGGKIVEAFDEKEADKVINAAGKFLLPGVIDPHVHFRTPGAPEKETWETGSRAAAMGGVTTVLDMPNTNPPTTNAAALAEKRALVKGKSFVNYGFFAGATEDVEALKGMKGVVGVKIYMASSTGDLLLDQPDVWEDVFKLAKAKNWPVVVHAEKESRIRAGQRDCACAREATEAALDLRKRTGGRLHIAHLSCKSELDLLREYKDKNVTCEVTPHHLFFTMDDTEDGFLKMNPPLRTLMDLEALWRGLLDGTVSCIATDHAPHTRKDKDQDFEKAPAGVPGVEFSLPLMLNAVNESKWPLERLVLLMSEKPAEIFGLKGKGKVAVGYDADLVLVDMELTAEVESKNVQSKCGWTPYEYFNLKGWPVLTMVNGEVVMDKRKIVGKMVGEEVKVG